MSKVLLKSLLLSPAVFGAALAVSASAMAADANATSNEAIQNQASVQTQASLLQPQELKVNPEAAGAVTPLEASKETSTLLKQQPTTIAQAAPESGDANTLDQINRYSREGRTSNQAGQVTSVSQLTDVRPTDWAFQALQSLVERYGCIVGYPDKKYRGNQAMTRYEFAAGLNACLDRINELIAAGTADLVKKEDLAILQKLQEEFAAELAALRGRVDALEARTATLEKQQFSTTTKLAGEVIFAVTNEFNIDGNNPVFQDRVRLALNTSFTGSDLLVTRLAAGNAGLFSIPTDRVFGQGGAGAEGIQTFNFGNTGGNAVYADWVAYYFSIGENVRVYIPAVSGLHYDNTPTLSPALDVGDGGTGPLSVFAQRNPIYNIGGGSGINIKFGGATSPFSINAGYLANNSRPTVTGTNPLTGVTTGVSGPITFAANNPADGFGLFDGSYAAIGQVAFDTGKFGIGATYVHSYSQGAIFDTGAGLPASGTFLANTRFRNLGAGTFATFPANVNAYGVSGYFKLSDYIVINAFGSFIQADFVGDGVGDGDIWTYGLGLSFPDLGKKGNLLGIVGGVEPYLGNPNTLYPGLGSQNDLPIHIEGFYKYQLTDNISITPGVIYIINPGQDDRNENAIIGTLRTTFTF
ncbi:iron uptake porin [Kovacikia minuta CCNUW1]|uniref:iron uptake porin n=1 Tax=Kovacikia minuta TaxID=2931930 RepID=UPI001CCA3B73|nr:iron uptake porin [Kovacikia minuta]UBF28165.1 iron uptake porin [Kovacikia minuta CCNUW1]